MSLPRYESYRDSGRALLGDVPSHWSVKPLRHLADLNPSKSELSNLPDTTELSFLPMEAIGEDGSFDLSRTRVLGEVKTGYSYLTDGDVVFAKVTPCFENGKGGLIGGLLGGIGFGTTELTVLRPHRASDGPFLRWLTSSSLFRKPAEGEMTGAGGLRRVPDEFVASFPVPWPTPLERDAIAAFLDRETAKIDALVEAQRRLIELLKEKRQAVISHAVTKGLDPAAPMKDSGVEWLGEVPAHWQVRSISSASTKITNGYVGPTREIFVDEGIRYLQSLHIKRNKIIFHTPYFVSERWSLEHSKSILVPGDVLIVQTGDVGQSAVVPPDFAGCNCHALIIISPKRDAVNGEWISWILNSDYGLHTLRSIQTGALHPHLNCGDVKGVMLPLPPLEEQANIAKQIEIASASCDELVDEALSAMTLLQERRSALISAAVTGKIDVRGLVKAETAEAA